jgi:NAD(P)-dependent dehydrogenase (short-subunit alcohol dehydrogenase family)
MGIAHFGADAAIKGAMNAMTRSIAVEYALYIRCTTVEAGPFMAAGFAP